MSEQLLFILKLCLLAFLYLFFFRVLRAVWAETRTPPTAAPDGEAKPSRRARRRATRKRQEPVERPRVPQLVVVAPAEESGRVYPVDDETSIGRAAGCRVTLDDTYASQIHARVFRSDGRLLVEDLGSTNGTYLNRHRVAGPMVLSPGDRLQIGNTVLELR